MKMKKISTYNIYNMHKYWGKKPSNILSNIIQEYSEINDLVLDPFSGYGGVGIESIILNRNVILNDLNPIATFISENILEKNVCLDKFNQLFLQLKCEYEKFEKSLFYFNENKIISILRDDEIPIKLKLKKNKILNEYVLNDQEIQMFLEYENKLLNNLWYPKEFLIPNSRICIKDKMMLSDLFSKRTLFANSILYSLIDKLPESNEKKLLMLAFTSNVANCSKLIPPISTRGDMSPGAWMTGFYLPKKFIENNVFHYFENRIKKIIKGKKDFFILSEKTKSNFKIYNSDAKKLPIKNSTIDLVITDFPYGDTVPYFEQSQLWNLWLNNQPDYQNEIVISDSKTRNKNILNFSNDINESIKEIHRVLKENKFFVFTFHSMSFDEWKPIINSLYNHNFKFITCYILNQKTLPPRQISRSNSIKGDIVVVYKKSNKQIMKKNFIDVLEDEINKNKDHYFDKNKIFELIIFSMLKSNWIAETDFKKIMDDYFIYNEEKKKWKVKNLVN